MEGFKADLHTHTTCSDGSMTPRELLLAAKAKGLQGLSITDHDTIDAYCDLFPFAEEVGVQLLPGVELSTMHKGVPVHILGYAFSPSNQLLSEFCQQHKERRKERNQLILDKLKAHHNLEISEEELLWEGKSGGTIGRPHIAKAMLAQGFISSFPEAFNRYIGEGKCCYDPGHPITIEETIACIHDAGGIAVIAHPHLIQPSAIIHELLEMPFDGIEVYYARFTEVQVKRWAKMAERKGLLMTGGSDYHGTIKENPLGCSFAPVATFSYLYERFTKNQAATTR